MIKISHDTAILIFSRPSVNEGMEKKLISQNQTANTSSLKWLRNRTVQVVQATGLPGFLIEKQEGDSFGLRLANAFQKVFDQGYQKVIAIGNDCMELTTSDLRNAADRLNNGDVVLGPDRRNGVYLIGLNRSQFDASRMAQLPWRSRQTFESLVEHFESCHILDAKQDLNNWHDLRQYTRLAARKYRKAFNRLIRDTLNWIDSETVHQIPNFQIELIRRGPPQAA